MDKGIRSSPATEDLSLATTMEKKIKALDSDLIVNEVFITNPASSSEFILGPCFRDGVPLELVPFYPLEKEKSSFCTLWNPGGTKPELGSHGHIQLKRGLIGLIDLRRKKVRSGEMLGCMMPFSFLKLIYPLTKTFYMLPCAFGQSQVTPSTLILA